MATPVLINKSNYTTNLKFDEIMQEAFYRCGIKQPSIDRDMIDNAIRSANIILINYNNKGQNLYSIQTEVFPIQTGLSSYQVPDLYDVDDVTMCSFGRQLSTTVNPGEAATNAGGNAELAFDGDPTTSCQNTTPNGEITYTFEENPVLVQFVGIQTAESDQQTYNLQFFYQTDLTNPSTKKIVYSTGPFTPFPNQPYYFYLNPPFKSLTWGVQEIGGATMNLAEVFFSQYFTSRILSPISRQDWMSLSNKNLTSAPVFPDGSAQPPPMYPSFGNTPFVVPPVQATGINAGYYIDRQPNPVINFFPPPADTYPYCVFTYKSYFQKISQLTDVLSIPGSFIPSIMAELAVAMATKYAFNRLGELKQQAQDSFVDATSEDREKVKFKTEYDFMQFRIN